MYTHCKVAESAPRLERRDKNTLGTNSFALAGRRPLRQVPAHSKLAPPNFVPHVGLASHRISFPSSQLILLHCCHGIILKYQSSFVRVDEAVPSGCAGATSLLILFMSTITILPTTPTGLFAWRAAVSPMSLPKHLPSKSSPLPSPDFALHHRAQVDIC